MDLLEELIRDEYLRFLIIFIGTIIFVTISYFILKLIVKRIAGRKKSYGEFILKKLSKPVNELGYLQQMMSILGHVILFVN